MKQNQTPFVIEAKQLFNFEKEGQNNQFDTTSNGCDPTTWSATTTTTTHCGTGRK
jgi:hypothetical protein